MRHSRGGGHRPRSIDVRTDRYPPPVLDLAFVVFVIAIAWLGWFRGFISQVAGLGSAIALWIFFDLWYPPIDLALAGLGHAFADYPYIRKLVGFVGAYFVCMLVIFGVEAGFIRKVAALEVGNRGLGVVVGALKGVLYATALLFFVETAILWQKPGDDPVPSWMRDSVALHVLGPYNPIRVFTLKEALENRIARRGRTGDAEGDDDSAAEDRTAPPPPLEESSAVRRLFKASPIRKLMEEAAGESEWQGRGYGDMVMDPKVREVLGDAGLVELLLGE